MYVRILIFIIYYYYDDYYDYYDYCDGYLNQRVDGVNVKIIKTY